MAFPVAQARGSLTSRGSAPQPINWSAIINQGFAKARQRKMDEITLKKFAMQQRIASLEEKKMVSEMNRLEQDEKWQEEYHEVQSVPDHQYDNPALFVDWHNGEMASGNKYRQLDANKKFQTFLKDDYVNPLTNKVEKGAVLYNLIQAGDLDASNWQKDVATVGTDPNSGREAIFIDQENIPAVPTGEQLAHRRFRENMYAIGHDDNSIDALASSLHTKAEISYVQTNEEWQNEMAKKEARENDPNWYENAVNRAAIAEDIKNITANNEKIIAQTQSKTLKTAGMLADINEAMTQVKHANIPHMEDMLRLNFKQDYVDRMTVYELGVNKLLTLNDQISLQNATIASAIAGLEDAKTKRIAKNAAISQGRTIGYMIDSLDADISKYKSDYHKEAGRKLEDDEDPEAHKKMLDSLETSIGMMESERDNLIKRQNQVIDLGKEGITMLPLGAKKGSQDAPFASKDELKAFVMDNPEYYGKKLYRKTPDGKVVPDGVAKPAAPVKQYPKHVGTVAEEALKKVFVPSGETTVRRENKRQSKLQADAERRAQAWEDKQKKAAAKDLERRSKPTFIENILDTAANL